MKYGDVMVDSVPSSDAKGAARSKASWNITTHGPMPLAAPLRRRTSSFDAERITHTKRRRSLSSGCFWCVRVARAYNQPMTPYDVAPWVAIGVIALEVSRAFIGFPDWLRERLHRSR